MHSQSVINMTETQESERPSDEAKERANFARLCSLVLDLGRRAAEDYVLGKLPCNQSLSDVLQRQKYRRRLHSLLSKGVVSQTQIDILYPSNGDPVQEDKIDLTLWVVLLRNITTMKPREWMEFPKPTQTKPLHDIQRLKLIRNEYLAHNETDLLQESEFQHAWKETESALLRLDIPQKDIDGCLERHLDKSLTTRMFEGTVKVIGGLKEKVRLGNIVMVGLFLLLGAVLMQFLIIYHMKLVSDSQQKLMAEIQQDYVNKTSHIVTNFMKHIGKLSDQVTKSLMAGNEARRQFADIAEFIEKYCRQTMSPEHYNYWSVLLDSRNFKTSKNELFIQ